MAFRGRGWHLLRTWLCCAVPLLNGGHFPHTERNQRALRSVPKSVFPSPGLDSPGKPLLLRSQELSRAKSLEGRETSMECQELASGRGRLHSAASECHLTKAPKTYRCMHVRTHTRTRGGAFSIPFLSHTNSMGGLRGSQDFLAQRQSLGSPGAEEKGSPQPQA